MDSMAVPRKLWEHPGPKSTKMWQFMQKINQKEGLQLKTFQDLYQYSITHRSSFWSLVFHFLNLIHSGTYTRVVDETARMDSIPRWFTGVYLNYAENILYSRPPNSTPSHRSTIGKEDYKIAVTAVREGATELQELTWAALRKEVAVLASAMREHGIEKGDRVAVVASNSIDTLKVFLATASLGGLFSSSSTDMGVQGILQRLVQIETKFVFMDDFAVYNGKTIDLRDKIWSVVEGMKEVKEFEGIVTMPRFKRPADVEDISRTQTLEKFLRESKTDELHFEKTTFSDPFLIAFSSGTTGTPKCIVHGIGNVLIAAGKENMLHRRVDAESVTMQYTTTGWIMYLQGIMTLLLGARIVLYDGSPFQPDPLVLVKLMGEQKVTKFGTSPRWMQEMMNNGISPREMADLSNLQMVTSTGMVLSDQLFEWFYDVGFPSKVQLANISGGTEMAGCFGMENPLTPVYVGGTQGPSLGVGIAVYDSLIEGGPGVKGTPLPDGTPGDLVGPTPFPNMPVFFWNDPDGSRYHSAYFDKFDNVWTHGDFVMIHPVTKGLIFLGRADGVLNPSGVRFGSAEIYSVLEKSFPTVADGICVGQRRPQDHDETVMLFLMMKPGEQFSKKLVDDVKSAIRRELSPRHVPKYVFETPDIPTTVNLKKVELPVKRIVSGNIVKPSGTLLNPQSLDFYYQFAKVEELVEPKSKI